MQPVSGEARKVAPFPVRWYRSLREACVADGEWWMAAGGWWMDRADREQYEGATATSMHIGVTLVFVSFLREPRDGRGVGLNR